MNGAVAIGDDEEEEDDETTTGAAETAPAENGVACSNDGYAAGAASRQNSEISIDGCSNCERSDYPSPPLAGELHVQVEQLPSSNMNCPMSKSFFWNFER